MKKLIFILLLFSGYLAFADQPAQKDPMRDLFPPDKIMERREELGFTEKQKKELLGIIQKQQPKLMEYQWDLQDSQKSIFKAFSTHPVNISEVEPLLKTMLQKESEMKLLHLKMLLKVRNVLTAEQVKILKSTKK